MLRAISTILVITAVASSCAAAEVEPDCGGLYARFEFNERLADADYPSVPPHQQHEFKRVFCKAAEEVKAWFVEQKWLPPHAPAPLPSLPTSGSYLPRAQLQIFVANAYQISRSLVPAWLGQRGRMEFPAVEAVAGEAAMAHELVHVFFPNGNRMLAEGLAVYLQQALYQQQPPRTNPAFPNFGEDLHLLARQYTCSAPQQGAISLARIDLVGFDRIATPNELRLRGGRQLDERPGPNYTVAGSFVRFLIENLGPSETDESRIKKFYELYLTTPLVPLERDPGKVDRWKHVYGIQLADIQDKWKEHIRPLMNCP